MNKRILKARVLAIAPLLILPSLCHAWGGMSHQIVALIAEDELTPAAKASIADLLGPDVHISDAEIANWADEVRRQRQNTVKPERKEVQV